MLTAIMVMHEQSLFYLSLFNDILNLKIMFKLYQVHDILIYLNIKLTVFMSNKYCF